MTTQSENPTPEEAPAITPPVNYGRRLARLEALYSQAMVDIVAKDAYLEDCREHIATLEAQVAEVKGNSNG
ncbi:UNVERIFIED_CONTAM: hypothetical protein RF653_09995 [Kocuria sp. CPCC 205316]|uniref:hypothetical protein n=1 Tax=Kocuria TaxID=57493 RepID=UPI0036DBA372